MEVEQQLEACPSIAGSFFDLAVSGTTQGPVKAPSVVAIAIDIKPGSAPNSINPASKGVLPVAILTTSSFDAASVDLGTVRFGAGQAQEAHGTEHSEDVDGDGDTDPVLHFATQDTGIHMTTHLCIGSCPPPRARSHFKTFFRVIRAHAR
jgi:hypothetical protein